MKTNERYTSYLVAACVHTDYEAVRLYEVNDGDSLNDGETLEQLRLSIDGNPSDIVWSIYGLANGQGSECVGDFPSAEVAMGVLWKMCGIPPLDIEPARLVYRLNNNREFDIAVTGAFLTTFAHDAFAQWGETSPCKQTSYDAFIGEICQFAPMIEDYYREVADRWDGVWLYDIVEAFGRWVAEEVAAGKTPSPKDARDNLMAMVAHYLGEEVPS